MIRRNVQVNDQVKRAREHQRQRESLSTTLPGYDSAMNTASRILNLSQDDLDDIMSTTDESFQVRIYKFEFYLSNLLSRDNQSKRMAIKMKNFDIKFRNYSFHKKNSLESY